jgi:hypothetical protein
MNNQALVRASVVLTLALLVASICGADHPNLTIAADNLAVTADFLD